MAEYIEREAEIEKINHEALHSCYHNRSGEARGLMLAKDLLQKAPTADVEPVRRGEWIKKDTSVKVETKDGIPIWTTKSWCFICSECNKIINNKQFEEAPNYCCHCGSKNEIRRGDE